MKNFSLDRRIIFILTALAVAIPLLVKIGFPNKVSAEADKFYQAIDTLPPSTVILVSFDNEASSLPEVKPMAVAILRHCFSKNLKIISLSLLAEGTAIGEGILRETASEYKKVYGEDYIFLGYRPQPTATILSLGESIKSTFPQDYYKNSTDTLNILKSLKNYQHIPLIITIADGDLPITWINYAGTRYKKDINVAITAVMATSIYPYLQSGQIKGLVSGLKGAAEYEILIKKEGMGTKGMDAQSIAHLLIILLVIFGNVTYFWGKK
jgi:hypothetical protein